MRQRYWRAGWWHLRDLTFTDERTPVVVHYDIELDDAGLDPYAFRVYQRIARRCAGASAGKCNESLDSMAAACRMSRAQMTKSLRVLIQRQMIHRDSKSGHTSHYALLDKRRWLSLEEWEEKYLNPATTEPPTRLPNSQGVATIKPGVATIKPGVATIKPGGGYTVATKKTREEDKKEREPRVSSSSVKAPANVARFVIPANTFDPTKDDDWSVGERFVLKACDLWEKPILELDPKIKISVKANGKWVNERIDVKAQIGGTPTLFREFWFNELKRKVNPRPEYVVEQWDAYDRWLIENHETHRQGRAA